jgi:hypothetical protein
VHFASEPRHTSQVLPSSELSWHAGSFVTRARFATVLIDSCRGVAAKVKVVRCTDKSCELAPSSVDVGLICDVYHHLEYPKSFMRA